MALLIFLILAGAAVAAALGVVLSRHPIYNVLFLVVAILSLAGLFLTLDAEFLAALQVIVYAGAIMVLFLFILMTVGVETVRERLFPLSQWWPASLLGALYLGVGAVLLSADPGAQVPLRAAVAAPRAFGEYIFRQHLLAVEVVSLLLLVALVGALYLGRARTARPLEPGGEP